MSRPPIHGHGYGSPTYKSWRAMKSRCTLECMDNYADYGGRGVTYDPAWESFEKFLADMGSRPEGYTLDRRNVDGNYTKDNCRWATASEQQRNKRSFVQPPGRTYGEGTCKDCGAAFTKMSPISRRCPPCVTYSRRYHKYG